MVFYLDPRRRAVLSPCARWSAADPEATASKKKPKAGLNVKSRTRSHAISTWIKIMRNSRKFAALTFASASFAAATPALACFDWGYSGAYSHGWPYANAGFTSYPAYHYRSCGGYYNIPGWGECGGYGRCGWAPLPAPVVALPIAHATATVPEERVAPDRLLLQRTRGGLGMRRRY